VNDARSTATGTADAAINADAPAPLLIDAKAACALLCMGPRRLWTLTNNKAIPSRKIGRSVRYVPAELAAWVAAGCPCKAGSGLRIIAELKGDRK
jgi:predicted DNA-binding transcriptional regulator AlpA